LGSGRRTVINWSTENPTYAAASIINGVPAVFVVSPDYWQGKKSKKTNWDVPVVRCPAEYRDISCRQCGNGKPLCAQLTRNFIVGFTAHGPGKKKACSENKGGCYASHGNCRIWWQETATKEQKETDAQKIKKFAESLFPGTVLRHHVAGDIGQE
jgi:hypothetical protein